MKRRVAVQLACAMFVAPRFAFAQAAKLHRVGFVEIELVINARAAKALGIAIPPSLRLRADRVIE